MLPLEIATETKITVLADHQLANRKTYRERVWKPARALHADIGSYPAWRRVLVEVEDYDGKLYLPDQRPYRHEEVYAIFSDISNRWMGLFLEDDGTGHAPKRYAKPQTYERLRLIELYCRLHGESEIAA